ncbi:hypothetical protein AKJ57_03660 [candidate division MSBL1 archaeon SCGC-AAA259A05]|uniref:FAD-binding domain-containing protein n=1 Tax=candidate division MSBL1 archaeon SCGC-AAA259A05 TaxID=1698259 RepID=A0A133U9D9_9EURY|nr:hypothetical protein AKJ57_03660 [candidate division MSBL1 archaeon SCGC-AAA259A05]
MKVEVIGGGPAGLRASRLLAEMGHDVTLCEAGEIGDNVSCGEAYLNVYPEVERPRDGLIREYARVLHREDGREFQMDGRHIYQYDRGLMERGMRERAESVGVHIRENCMREKPSNDCLTVDASGFPSILYSPSDYDCGFAVSCLVAERTERMTFDWTDFGYYWSFPKREMTNAGFGVFRSPFKDVRGKAVRYSQNIGGIEKISGGFIPYSFDGALWNSEARTVLIGDAAGLCNSFHGGGIHTALLSANMVANTIDGLDRYQEELMGRMDDELQFAEVTSSFREDGRLGELIREDDNIRDVTHPSSFRKVSVFAKWKVPIF